MRKTSLCALFAVAIGIGSAHAEVVVKVRPPKAVVEHRSARPSKDHVWVGGYQRWDGNAYAWESGRWEKPPHPHAKWVAPKYTRRGHDYVLWKAAGARCQFHQLQWHSEYAQAVSVVAFETASVPDGRSSS